jgi:hypothetical protein
MISRTCFGRKIIRKALLKKIVAAPRLFIISIVTLPMGLKKTFKDMFGLFDFICISPTPFIQPPF